MYDVNRDKALTLAVIGELPLKEGINLAAAHVDVPRIDPSKTRCTRIRRSLCSRPTITAVLKYQWVAIPSRSGFS